MLAPTYNIGDTVYLKESAQAGFLEAVRVSSVSTVDGQWVYSIELGTKAPTATTFGDRITYQRHRTLYFNESELVTFCDAADLVEAVLTQRLTEIRTQRDDRC